MKRYDHICQPMKLRDLCEYSDGNYVLFTDAQADKHAALKELALLVLPHVKHTDACDQSNIGSLCDCGKFALISKLKFLTEGPV